MFLRGPSLLGRVGQVKKRRYFGYILLTILDSSKLITGRYEAFSLSAEFAKRASG